jgi:hypothetical protein
MTSISANTLLNVPYNSPTGRRLRALRRDIRDANMEVRLAESALSMAQLHEDDVTNFTADGNLSEARLQVIEARAEVNRRRTVVVELRAEMERVARSGVVG